jgi:hypothetical protein
VRQNVAFNPLNSFTPAVSSTGTIANLTTGFPPAPTAAIPADGIITNPQTTSQWTVVNQHYKDPYVMSYNATIEEDLGKGWVANLAYVGNLGRQVPAYYNINAGVVAGAGAAGQPEFLPFHRTAVTQVMGVGTNSNYNGLQARLTHRFSNGLSWTSGYAYQKAMGFISTGGGLGSFNFYLDPRRDYAPLNWNRTHTYSQSFVYELPFGRNKPLLHDGMAALIAGGKREPTERARKHAGTEPGKALQEALRRGDNQALV